MAENIDDLTIDYEENGRQTRRVLDKAVLTRGAWSTIAYLFQEVDKDTDDWGDTKVSVRRYKKQRGDFREQSRFNISNGKQARALVEVLTKWFPPGAEDEAEAPKAKPKRAPKKKKEPEAEA